MQLLFNPSYPSILINFTSPSSSSILLQRIGNDISRPLRSTAPRENVFSSENYRSKIQTASPLPVTVRAWFLRISIPRVFLERGSDIPDENKRIKGRHCWSFLEKRSSRDCFSLFLSRSRRNRSNRRRSNLPLLPSRWTNATMCISRALG